MRTPDSAKRRSRPRRPSAGLLDLANTRVVYRRSGERLAVREELRVYDPAMCRLSERIVLCSCDGETLADPDWILERQDLSIPVSHRRGRAMMPRFNADEQSCIDAIRVALDAGEAFDFEYSPQEGDVLRLGGVLVDGAAQRRNVRFRVVKGRWQHDRSTGLAGWRVQMVEQRRGELAGR